MIDQTIIEQVSNGVNAELPRLAPHLRTWVESHLIPLREIEVYLEPEGLTPHKVWLITDDTGHNDSSYRIIYDKLPDRFGLITETDSGELWLLGMYPSFKETVESM